MKSAVEMLVPDDALIPDALRQVLRRDGDMWTVAFGGRTCQLRDTRGLRYLAHLLARPHQSVASTLIDAAARGLLVVDDDVDAAARERARVNVTRGLSAALRRLEPHHPELARHLRATVRAGAACTYTPDPRLPTRWET